MSRDLHNSNRLRQLRRPLSVTAAAATCSLCLTLSASASASSWWSVTGWQSADQPAGPETSAKTASSSGFKIGKGMADITGEPGENAMLGYGTTGQNSTGVHMRQHARAFIIEDAATGDRVVHVMDEIGLMQQSIRQGVLAKLKEKFGDKYNESNVMLTASHTHVAPGGYGHHSLYNVLTAGVHEKTYNAIVDGTVQAIEVADANMHDAELSLSSGTVTGTQANRSMKAFERNPAEDKAPFPNGIDTTMTSLQMRENGNLSGVINWFPIHSTSLPPDVTLISGDNRGYSMYRWETDDKGVNQQTESNPRFMSSFAMSSAGDITPNLDLKPGKGPTDNPWLNQRIIGQSMVDTAMSSTATPGTPVASTGIDSRITYVDFSKIMVDGKYTTDGKPHSTCNASLGAAFAAGSDEGPGFTLFKEGSFGGNEWFKGLVDAFAYNVQPDLKACQNPKEILLPVGDVNWSQQRLPLQIFRIGDLYMVGLPFEPTTVAGYKVRQAVAAELGVPLDKIIMQGYANSYGHYLTTPYEYEQQDYEGGATPFGKHQLGATIQEMRRVARSLADGTALDLGDVALDRSKQQLSSPAGKVVIDMPMFGKQYGNVLTQPDKSYARGKKASARFVGAHPNNNIRHGGSYITVERKTGDTWQVVADDNHPDTKYNWKRGWFGSSEITVEWEIPANAEPGMYRIQYFGDAKDATGKVSPISGTSDSFTVS